MTHDNPFRVIIAGSRHLTLLHYPEVAAALDHLLKNRLPNVVVLSGAAKGADALGEAWAKARGLPVERYPIKWDRDGNAAAANRNYALVCNADALVCFRDPDGNERPVELLLEQARGNL